MLYTKKQAEIANDLVAVLDSKFFSLSMLVQQAARHHHSRMRRDLLKLDDHLADMLAFTGRGE